MKKEISGFQLCVITLFIGILLTGFIVYTVNATVDADLAPRCYDGSRIEGEGFLADFHRAVYQDATTLSTINEYRYRLFGADDHPNVFAGQGGFLFQLENKESGYSYIEDYLGNQPFTAGECSAILEQLLTRRAAYAEQGAHYLLVVLPNTQTLYDENMPLFFGSVSRQTRLATMESYLRQHGFRHFINTANDLEQYKNFGLLANNTENSLNARGLYFVYYTICKNIDPEVLRHTDVLRYEEIDFYQHDTQGKAIAKEAGLDDVATNQTVSLVGNIGHPYRYVYGTGTTATTLWTSFDFTDAPSLLLQFGGEWERSQAEPFFSGSFPRVTYQTGLDFDQNAFSRADPDIVIQFVREDELASLLPGQ